MIRMHRRISWAVTVLAMAALLLTGCTSEASSISSAKNKAGGADMVDTGFTMSTVGSYDSADTAVVLSTDEANKAVTFINMESGKSYTLYYDGTTYVKDKHDGPMTISQIEPGDVVDVTFLKGKKRLASIKKSPEAWVYDNVYNYDLTGANRTASIGTQSYSLPESVVVLSEGRRVDKAEVVSQDVVTISGIDHKIYSVNVDKGHGYLSLKNEQPLLGGWIEIGNTMIRQISEDMLLVVPEGTYQVVLNNNGIGCVKEVTIERDKEVVLDVDDIEIPEDATGKILFSVTPENATVSVDNKPVDISKVVELPYGIHRVEASASGYDTLTKHIQVGSEYATISFKLEESRKEDKNSVSGNSITREPWEDTYDDTPVEKNSVSDNILGSVSENALRSSKNGTAEIHVKDWDTGVELSGVTVRLEIEDSNKKITSTRSKTSPCSFSKEKDAHKYRFILSLDGYETKTLEPDLEEYLKDETLYFMIKKKESSSTTNNNTNTNTRISTNVISAVATAGTGCDLTYGPDENTGDAYVTSASTGNLWKTGQEKLGEAVKSAVQTVVGTAEIDSYYFKVDGTLKDVTPLESGGHQAKASVTIGRNGYREEIIPVMVVIKEKAEEPTEQEVAVSWDIKPVEAKDVITKIVIDNNSCDDFPIKLLVGKVHMIEVEAEGYEKFSKEFEITGDGETIEINLQKKNVGEEAKVSFWINSDEIIDNYQITIDDKERSDFPDRLSYGSHTVKVEADGYKEWEKTIDITEDETSIVIDLEKEEPENPTLTDPASADPNTPVESTLTDPETIVDSIPTNSDNSDAMETQSFSMTQQSYPIRNFFSSLFK